MQKNKALNIKKGDFVIFFGIIMIGITLLLFNFNKTVGNYAVLAIDGEVVTVFSHEELQSKGQKAYQAHGYHFIIQYSDGKIWFLENDCPDQICVLSGKLEKAGDISACAPAHAVLKMLGSKRIVDDETIDIQMR